MKLSGPTKPYSHASSVRSLLVSPVFTHIVCDGYIPLPSEQDVGKLRTTPLALLALLLLSLPLLLTFLKLVALLGLAERVVRLYGVHPNGI